MTTFSRAARRHGLLASTMLLTLAASALTTAAFAQDTQTDQPDVSDSAIKTVIVKAERSKAAATAPTKASVDATQPQSIISRPYIDLVVPETGDFTNVAQIAPSVSGTQGNGAGYGDAKLVLRGFQDGEYNVTYDGIAYGDTNDPSHHSNTFFPASTIGALVVDRGPGMAGDLGQANFGGAIHMYSNKVTDDASFTQKLSYGSFNSYQAVSIIQTGVIPDTGGMKALVNLQTRKTDGALSYFGLKSDNWEVKAEKPFGDHWKLTFLATHNQNFSYSPDNDGATLAQVAMYGKNFDMTNDPSSPTYYKYNRILKNTAFAYAKLEGDLGGGWTLDDTVYTYFYSNKTLSALDTTGYTAPGVYRYPTGVDPYTTTTNPVNDKTTLSGYDKFNYYDVNGDILRVNKQFSFGTLKMGGLAETSDTLRHRYDYAINQNDPYDTSTPDYREKNCVTEETAALAKPTRCAVNDRSVQYQERSWWTQYQLFADFIWTPTDNLTVTPGVKSLQFTRNLAGKIKAKPNLALITTPESETFRKTLPFLTVNYKLQKNWSLYGQYAQGFLVPPLKDLYVNDLSNASNVVAPEQTTNYQFGTVYNGGHVSVDADVYQIDFKNKFACNNIYCYNQGGVTYKGVEGQAAYAFDFGLTVFANASMNSAKSNDTHLTISQAPKSTLGFGGIFRSGPVKAALTFKQVGEQWAADGEPIDYKIKAYNNVNLAVSYDFAERYTVKLQVDNLLDSRNVTKISVNDGPIDDQYYFQAPTNAMLTLSAKF